MCKPTVFAYKNLEVLITFVNMMTSCLCSRWSRHLDFGSSQPALFVLQKRFELAPNFVFPYVRSIIISIFKLNNFNKNCFQCFLAWFYCWYQFFCLFQLRPIFWLHLLYFFEHVCDSWSWFFSIYSGVIENYAKKENLCSVVKEIWNVFQIFFKNCFYPCNDVPADLTLHLLINVQFLASLYILTYCLHHLRLFARQTVAFIFFFLRIFFHCVIEFLRNNFVRFN